MWRGSEKFALKSLTCAFILILNSGSPKASLKFPAPDPLPDPVGKGGEPGGGHPLSLRTGPDPARGAARQDRLRGRIGRLSPPPEKYGGTTPMIPPFTPPPTPRHRGS